VWGKKILLAINRIWGINCDLRASPAVKLGLAFKLNYAHVSLVEFIESYGVNHKQTLKTWLG
jgi:hypothetical protein